MELKKQNGPTKLKKLNVVNPEKNTAVTMAHCTCHCVCGEYPNTDNNAFGATHGNIMYALGG